MCKQKKEPDIPSLSVVCALVRRRDADMQKMVRLQSRVHVRRVLAAVKVSQRFLGSVERPHGVETH